jgi:hypothetical protein
MAMRADRVHVDQVRHRRSWPTHPVVPLVLFTGALILGGILASEVIAWAAFGALAGYSLSGST